jgi:hypothetical protein
MDLRGDRLYPMDGSCGMRGNGKAGAKRRPFRQLVPAASIPVARSCQIYFLRQSKEKGRPVGEPGALALSRLRREGIPALCRRPWPFERGTGVATPNGRRYFLDVFSLVTRRRHLAMAAIDAGLSRFWHVPAPAFTFLFGGKSG